MTPEEKLEYVRLALVACDITLSTDIIDIALAMSTLIDKRKHKTSLSDITEVRRYWHKRSQDRFSKFCKDINVTTPVEEVKDPAPTKEYIESYEQP
jgi:hypothetical protein